MVNYFSVEEALEELQKLKNSGEPITQGAIEKIIAQVSVADKNATTLLYTTGGKYNGDVSRQRYIGNTEAYDFMN